MTALRVGVIGAGSMGRAHAFAVAGTPSAELVAVCDTDLTRAEALCSELGSGIAVSRLNALLDAGVDAVVIATPEAFHHEPAMAVLAAGKHALIEKPLTTDLAQAREIVAAAKHASTVVIPGFNLRYDERHRELKRWLDDGYAGALTSLYVRRNRPAALFDTYQRVHPGFESTSHDLDLVLWLTGQRVRTVRATQRQRDSELNPFGLWSLLELDDGTVVTTEAVWSIPEATGVMKGDVVEIIGDAGTAHVDVNRGLTSFWDARGVTDLDRPLLTTASRPFVSIDTEIADFVDCALQGRPSQWASLDDALHVVEVVDAMIRSAGSGQPVTLEGA